MLLISLVLTLLAHPWLSLSWWRVFRRCVSIASAISLWLVISKAEHRSIRSYGFLAPRAGKRQFLFGLGLGLGTLGIVFGIGLAGGLYRISITPDAVKLWRVVVGFIPAALLVGILEELVFRGFLLQHLLRYSTSAAVIASSALYSLVHLKGAEMDLALSMRELAGLFLLGVVLALSYLRTSQLYLAVGLHAALAYGARVNKLVMEILPDESIGWFVGTSRLVNGALGWGALLAMGGIMVWWTSSSHRGGLGDEKTA